MMNTILIIFLSFIGLWLLFKLFNSREKDNYNRDTSNYNRNATNYDKKSEKEKGPRKSIFSFLHKTDNGTIGKAKKQSLFARIFSAPLPFNDEAIIWCANFLVVEKDILIKILRNTDSHYTLFKLGKRSGGYRTISAPSTALLNLQRTIYKRVLLSASIHPTCMGFRQSISVADNARVHLGNQQLLKIDIADFFGSIKKNRVIQTFEKIGYPTTIAQVLSELCILEGKLPQGAVTSPTLSNIVAYNVDVQLVALAQKHQLKYTRYADDLTFSGSEIEFDIIIPQIKDILRSEGFIIQRKKTRILTAKKRKIVTGISISSGEKMTIPRAKKREIRKTVHYILTKGLAEHQRFVGSKDPAYMKRLIGYLNFWQMVEPDNEYVRKSIEALKKV